MKLLLILLSLALCSCSTTVYVGGKPALRTFANAEYLEFHQGNTSLVMTKMNHAIATRAAGSLIGTTFTGAAGLATTFATRGVVR